ncbi:protein kinase domain-containing protein [Fodinicola acaciae]|uniref:protein kinase domain-containing protein n=1 Tax=Fodinicola acaciae TaxID=2681555 RepID=UPI0013D88A32|nr:hypothetical protein [Fodinicola acaciae]
MSQAAGSAPEAVLDLVCGPESVLPESRSRYRLISHLASGGQAEVYRAVRMSAGVASSPVTVKVFRASEGRPLIDQLRSWDKGDAVLADLNVRGIPGICRRIEGFMAGHPHPPGTLPPRGIAGVPDEVPYQVLDYLPGWALRDMVNGAYPKVEGRPVLRSLADVLLALHHPVATASPVLHMDLTPANVVVLPDGSPRLIDFTGARYDRPDYITSVAFTAKAGGPEALTGRVGPAYDVHGFGAIAYFLVTGQLPREVAESTVVSGPEMPRARWSILKPAAALDSAPKLREHLLQPLMDQPGDRPLTTDLPEWVDRLAELAAAYPISGGLATWAGGRRSVRGSARVTSGAGAGAAAASFVATVPAIVKPADSAAAAKPPTAKASAAVAPTVPRAEPVNGTRVDIARPPETRGQARGASKVPVAPQPPQQPPTLDEPAAPPPESRRSYGPKRGRLLSILGGVFLGVCYMIWAAVTALNTVTGASRTDTQTLTTELGVAAVLALVAAIVPFWMCRLVGRLLLGWRQRRGALPSHLIGTAFSVLSGITFLSATPAVHIPFLN